MTQAELVVEFQTAVVTQMTPLFKDLPYGMIGAVVVAVDKEGRLSFQNIGLNQFGMSRCVQGGMSWLARLDTIAMEAAEMGAAQGGKH